CALPILWSMCHGKSGFTERVMERFLFLNGLTDWTTLGRNRESTRVWLEYASGDVKTVGGGVCELRLDLGPGPGSILGRKDEPLWSFCAGVTNQRNNGTLKKPNSFGWIIRSAKDESSELQRGPTKTACGPGLRGGLPDRMF